MSAKVLDVIPFFSSQVERGSDMDMALDHIVPEKLKCVSFVAGFHELSDVGGCTLTRARSKLIILENP
jgi:hypothetical protein